MLDELLRDPVLRPGGTFRRRITLSEQPGDGLQWLSDGRLAVYVSGDVLLMGSDGSNPKRVRLGMYDFDWLASGYAALNRQTRQRPRSDRHGDRSGPERPRTA